MSKISMKPLVKQEKDGYVRYKVVDPKELADPSQQAGVIGILSEKTDEESLDEEAAFTGGNPVGFLYMEDKVYLALWDSGLEGWVVDHEITDDDPRLDKKKIHKALSDAWISAVKDF